MTYAENSIWVQDRKKEAVLLPMSGRDKKGNLYQVDNISFLKNGRRFLPVMGEFHFSRYEPEGWKEELLKMRAGGVTIVATYVLWIHHEEKEGEWNFSGCRNLRAFLKICQELNMTVWLRIGPWAHGECRNGGFPDWLVQEQAPVRENNPVYLERVRRFWGKLGEQAAGMMCKDGGPVLGIQLENEYGHCGGPSDRKAGMAHMKTLKKMAIEAGFETPYYTATGWGGAYVVDGEMLPVLGGYVDAPWAEHTREMPACENFIFSSYKEDHNIGSDLKQEKDSGFTFDPGISPYLTAELGGGLQVTSHRRTYPWAEDIEAQALCMLGSGANLLGYYMYHGGINPDGKYTTLQESRATGYNNDVPVKSYDFQTCIRESGEINASFGKLKKWHLLLDSFGELLAGADTCFAAQQPASAEDLHTLRVTARINREAGAGFLMINNHQRKRKMEAHIDCSVRLVFGEKELILPHITAACGESLVLPFRLPEDWKSGEPGEQQGNPEEQEGNPGEQQGKPGEQEGKRAEQRRQAAAQEKALAACLPEQTNASLLCRIGNRVFLYSDLENPYLKKAADNSGAEYVILSRKQADCAFRIGNRLYVTERADSCLIEQDGQIVLLTKAEKETVTVYKESGEKQQIVLSAPAVQAEAKAELAAEQRESDGTLSYRDYRVRVEEPFTALQEGTEKTAQLNQVYLQAAYDGDRAEVYVDGKLADDWFTNGEKWHIALKRFGYPENVTLRIYPSDRPLPNPYGNQVYYDLPVKAGCALHAVEMLPEYRVVLPQETGFFKGMDISWLPQYEEAGMVLKDFDGTKMDALELAKKYGVNAIRLRLWNNPENIPESGGYCDFSHTLRMAKRIQKAGLSFLLDFHYSDYWADPAQQNKPKAWESLHGAELEEAVYTYTKETLEALRQEGVLPDMVQIGNEIRSGLLFPDGELPDVKGMVRLINAGIRGARQAGGDSMKIMIHLDQGGRYFYLREWFDQALANGLLDFDVIGLSYYPFWHGTFTDLKKTMEQLASDYHKPIVLAETAHAWRKSEKGFIDEAQEKIAGFPATPKGQRQVLELVMNITASLPDNMGQGIFYWEPFCTPKEGEGGWAENMGLLAADGTVMEGIRAFSFTRENKEPDKIAKIYPPKEIRIPIGGTLALPTEAGVLYADGSLRKQAVTWEEPEAKKTAEAGSFVLTGCVEGCGQKVSVGVTVSDGETECNLLQDANLDAGLACWNIKKSGQEALVSIVPEFTEPFPAPPVNALRVESVKNFTLEFWQDVVVQKAGTYLLRAEYLGTDTTNVDVRIFLETKEKTADTVIHPTEHEWQEAAADIEVTGPQTIRAGLRIVSPPIYGMVRRFSLVRKNG